jgi:small-conductance mechanosensitive channel
VKVGISWQSDPHEAIRLGIEAAKDVPRVLGDPAPNCLLVAFGDSTIDLELRSWIGDPTNGTANVRSQVMLNMWDLYQQHGIELPNPQRDLTLRNPEALAKAITASTQGSAKTQTLSSRADQRN